MNDGCRLRAVLRRLTPSLDGYWDRPLEDYAAAAYTAPPVERSSVRTEAFRKLQNAFANRARKLGFSDEDVFELINEMESNPVLQTGPHCHLVIEPDAFFTHAFGVIGLKAKNRKWYLSYAVSTVKFVESAKKGPGWLWLENQNVNVFGLSRSDMTPYSIMGRQSEKYFHCLGDSEKTEATSITSLKGALPTCGFPSASDAIKAANPALWERIFGTKIRFVQIDDDDVRELVLQHLQDPQAWLRNSFLTNLETPKAILREIDYVDKGFWSGWLKSTTHFFWHLDQGKLRPLKFVDDRLENESKSFSVAWDAYALSDALKLRVIIPNMFVAFLVLAILPGAKVLGGTRQIIYYPIMRRVFVNALHRSRMADDIRIADEVSHDQNSSAWGHRTIAPTCRDPWGTISNDIDTFIDGVKAESLSVTARGLPDFMSDKLWAKLLARAS